MSPVPVSDAAEAPVVLTYRPLPGRGDGAAVAYLTLNRPQRANSLTAELLEALLTALESLLAQAPPAALVLSGAGRHFSTGGDVGRFAEEVAAGRGRAYGERTVGTLHNAILRLVDLPCPVIAQVRGAVTGGATGLVLAADMVAMQRTAFFQPWYAVVGFAPDGGWTAMLPERIGTGRALSVQMLNQRIDAVQAEALGLATTLADDDAGLESLTGDWLDTLGRHKAGTLATTRALVWDAPRRAALAARLDGERRAFLDRLETEESRDGMAAFLTSLRTASDRQKA